MVNGSPVHLTLTVQTPLHIGNGITLSREESIVLKKQSANQPPTFFIYAINLQKLLSSIEKLFSEGKTYADFIDAYSRFLATHDTFSWDTFLKDLVNHSILHAPSTNGKSSSDFVLELLKPCFSHCFGIGEEVDHNRMKASHCFIFDPSDEKLFPYLPGCSIKGALKNALVWYELTKNSTLRNFFKKEVDQILTSSQSNRPSSATQSDDLTKLILKKIEEKITYLDIIGRPGFQISDFWVEEQDSSKPILVIKEYQRLGMKKTSGLGLNSSSSVELSYLAMLMPMVRAHGKILIPTSCPYTVTELLDIFKAYSQAVIALNQELFPVVTFPQPTLGLLQLGLGGNYYTKSLGVLLRTLYPGDQNLFKLRKSFKFGIRRQPHSSSIASLDDSASKHQFPSTIAVVKYNSKYVQSGWVQLSVN
ncbi:MAG: RAMP superfamily CRISPR-associated protein [Candidatus Woesearchaeota archaeon]